VRLPLGKAWLASCVAAAVLFAAFPGIDLSISGLFYRDGAFHLRDNAAMQFLYHYGEAPIRIAAGLALGTYAAAWALGRDRLLGLGRRAWLYLFLAALIGPGLLVNSVLKDHMGRARPLQVEQFGGDRLFTPALTVSRECARNCSFTCGHCAAGFYFMSLGFVLAGGARRAAFAGGLGLGAALTVVRLAQGGHFLSDAVFSLIAVYTVSALLHYAMFPEAYRSRPAAPGG
jgi:lipid A 4'-phosphatase